MSAGPGPLRRRTVLSAAFAGTCAALTPGCGARDNSPPAWQARWLGAQAERGHRLRALPADGPVPARRRRASVVVVGAGIAGLSAARALAQAGVDDVQVLDLEDEAGGNSRGHRIAGIACPLGAHYLPLPGPQAHEVAQWLEEIGIARSEGGRLRVDERHLCHSPQERLFIDGQWHEGLLPPAAAGSATLHQYQRFAAEVRRAQRDIGFAMPSMRAAWTSAHGALDAQAFSDWLRERGFDDARLLGHLDYCCRDDYGAGVSIVSAWAGLHYFASRHGFRAGIETRAPDDDAVLTWPEGNAWLARRLAAPLLARLHTGRIVFRITESRHEVAVDAWPADARRGEPERWLAQHVVIALPLFVAVRLLAAPPAALQDAASRQSYAPWLVANIHLESPPNERIGAPPAWDNVIFGSPGLGYVNATHQSLVPSAGATVLTAYWALPEAERSALLAGDAQSWAQRIVDQLAPVHPDLGRKARAIDLMRYGHAMSIPTPGLRSSAALQALAQPQRRLHFAHADLSAYSVFEEAFTQGHRAGGQAAAALGRSTPDRPQ
jgi:predicted NAD/FAD-dependent oxidoreductase